MALSNRNLEPGTVLAARYKKQGYRCEVVAGEDGKPRYRLADGREYGTPSAAASAVMGGTAANGWRFWSLEGDLPEASEPKAKRAKAAPKAKPSAKAKGGTKAKGGAKAKAKTASKAKGGRKAAKAPKASANGSRPVTCGDCGQEFPSSRAASAHMRDEHGSVEAQPGPVA